MIQEHQRYFRWIQDELLTFGKAHPGSQIFLFGSSIRKGRFGDIDVGMMGKAIEDKTIDGLKERFEQSSFPFIVDIVNFNTAREPFRSHILAQPLLWIQH